MSHKKDARLIWVKLCNDGTGQSVGCGYEEWEVMGLIIDSTIVLLNMVLTFAFALLKRARTCQPGVKILYFGYINGQEISVRLQMKKSKY